jgi:RNA-binding protein YhbY
MSNTRIYAQYADKPKAVEWFNITPSITTELFNVFESVRGSYDIDNANSAELDVIGRVVVIDRSFESKVFFTVDTAFGEDTNAAQFGGVDSQFESTGATISNAVSDSIFRVLIKAKIAKNNSDATLDGIAKALTYITSSSPIQVIDNEDMTFSVSFGTVLTDIEKFVFNTFDIMPRPQGVKFLGYVEEPAVTMFGGDFGWGDTRANFGLYFGV